MCCIVSNILLKEFSYWIIFIRSTNNVILLLLLLLLLQVNNNNNQQHFGIVCFWKKPAGSILWNILHTFSNTQTSSFVTFWWTEDHRKITLAEEKDAITSTRRLARLSGDMTSFSQYTAVNLQNLSRITFTRFTLCNLKTNITLKMFFFKFDI